MEQNNGAELLEYVRTLWRRKWLFSAVSFMVLLIAVYIITKLPVIYQSTGTILIERQEIPEQWVNSTITGFAEERIQAISQRVLTTENLERIIDKYGLFPERREHNTMEELVGLAGNNFSIESVTKSGPGRREAVAFRVSYLDSSAETAQDVANELVSLYLDENKKSRTQAAADTRRFLEVEADRLERELKAIEEKISKFKERNMGILPENQGINMQTYERVEQQIANINSTLMSLEDRQIVIESSIASARRALDSGAARPSDQIEAASPRQRLKELQSQFGSLQTRYSSEHPDLKRLKREIELLESQIGTGSAKGKGRASQDDTAIIQLRSDLKSTIAEQSSLQERKLELGVKLDDLEIRINKTPGVELEYRTLIRDHENTQNKYNDIRSKQNSARVSQSLEEEQKGERFTLIEVPRLAETPYSPDFSKAYMMAFALALLCGLGAVFGLESLDGTIRNARSVEVVSGVPVLATVGYIENGQDRRKRLYRRILIFVLIILVILIGFYLMDRYQIKLDEIRPRKTLKFVWTWISNFEFPE